MVVKKSSYNYFSSKVRVELLMYMYSNYCMSITEISKLEFLYSKLDTRTLAILAKACCPLYNLYSVLFRGEA